MTKTAPFICALLVLVASLTAHADGFSGLTAKMLEVAGAKAPVPVLQPGIRLNISGKSGGKVVPVFGTDHCPRDVLDVGRTDTGCIILDKPVVIVQFPEDGKLTTEQWKVVSKDNRTHLYRPDGTVITQPN